MELRNLRKLMIMCYLGNFDKVFMMGKEQQAVFQAELPSYCVFGGHGSGKDNICQG